MKTDFINELGVMFTENNSISDDIYNKLNVNRATSFSIGIPR